MVRAKLAIYATGTTMAVHLTVTFAAMKLRGNCCREISLHPISLLYCVISVEKCVCVCACRVLTDTAVRDVEPGGRVAVLHAVLLLAGGGQPADEHLSTAAAAAVDRRHDGDSTARRLAPDRQRQPVDDDTR